MILTTSPHKIEGGRFSTAWKLDFKFVEATHSKDKEWTDFFFLAEVLLLRSFMTRWVECNIGWEAAI